MSSVAQVRPAVTITKDKRNFVRRRNPGAPAGKARERTPVSTVELHHAFNVMRKKN
jgi:hypothetical protein